MQVDNVQRKSSRQKATVAKPQPTKPVSQKGL